MDGDVCARALSRIRLKGWDGERERGVMARSLNISYSTACALTCSDLAVCATRRVRGGYTCNTSDFEFSVSPPPWLASFTYARFDGKCEL